MWKKQIWKMLVSIMLLSAVPLLITACSGSASARQTPQDVNITLTEFTIQASQTEFQVGVPYHFVITNNGTVAHELEIMPPMSGAVSQDQVKSAALVHVTQDQLAPGTTATVDYTFEQAYPAGELEFACHLPGHHEAGMHVGIVVK